MIGNTNFNTHPEWDDNRFAATLFQEMGLGMGGDPARLAFLVGQLQGAKGRYDWYSNYIIPWVQQSVIPAGTSVNQEPDAFKWVPGYTWVAVGLGTIGVVLAVAITRLHKYIKDTTGPNGSSGYRTF